MTFAKFMACACWLAAVGCVAQESLSLALGLVLLMSGNYLAGKIEECEYDDDDDFKAS